MSEPRVVSPQEAQRWSRNDDWLKQHFGTDGYTLAHTVATEPKRTRAAVVEALRDLGKKAEDDGNGVAALLSYERANQVEHGALL